MSVIVKGMEMPLNCALCERWSICECLKEYKDYESILYAVDDGDLVRADDCPLIELPPHGRLIDIDKFRSDYGMNDECAKCDKELRGSVRECETNFSYRKMDFCGWIDDAETVIEAEGSEA